MINILWQFIKHSLDLSHCTSTKSVRPLIYPHISFARLDFSHKHLKNIWKVGGQTCLVTLELVYTYFWSKDLSMGLAYLYLLSRIMKFFSHLQNGQLIPCENERKFNLENKAQPRDFSTQIPLANLVMGQTPLDMHISRVFDFSRDARNFDPFLARKCEKCEKSFVP